MRAKFRIVILSLTLAFSSKSFSQQIRIERAVTPEPANIDELRKASKVKKLRPCKLPEVHSAEGWVRSFGPDEFLQIELAPDWTPQDPDTANSFFPEDPTASFRNANGDRIIIKREAYTPNGLPFVKQLGGDVVKPQSQCESIMGKAGTFMSFYGASRGMSGRVYYTALGSGVTPGGKHYGISLYAYSRAYLDTLAAIVTKAMIEVRNDSVARVPSFERFVLPSGYKGPFLAIYSQANGIDPTWNGDTATFQVPKDGILRIRFDEPPHSTLSSHVYADRPSQPLSNYPTCADMWVYVPDKRTGVCWLDFAVIGTGIPDHIVAVITDRDEIPLQYERTTAAYDSVVHGGKGHARRRWVSPPDSKISRGN